MGRPIIGLVFILIGSIVRELNSFMAPIDCGTNFWNKETAYSFSLPTLEDPLKLWRMQSFGSQTTASSSSSSFSESVAGVARTLREQPDNHFKKTYIRESLNELLASLPAQQSEYDVEPLAEINNVRILLSVMHKDPRFGLMHTHQIDAFYQQIPLVNSIWNACQESLPEGQGLNDLALLDEANLLKVFGGDASKLEEFTQSLANLIDRPITRITRVETGVERSTSLTQTPQTLAGVSEDPGAVSIVTGQSLKFESIGAKGISNALTVSDGCDYMLRSACTMTPSALIEMMMLNAINQSTNTGKPIEICIISAMDGLTGQMYDLIGADEKNMFSQLRASIDELWDGPDSLHTITILRDGKFVEQAVRKPVLLNIVLSSAASDLGTTRVATSFNKDQAKPLLDKLLQQHAKLTGEDLSNARHEKQIKRLLEVADDTCDFELKYAALALQAMSKHTYDGPKDALKQSVLIHFLLRKCGVAANYQCANGLDKAPVLLFAAKAVDLMIDGIKNRTVGRVNESNLSSREAHTDPKRLLYKAVTKDIDELLQYDSDSGWADAFAAFCIGSDPVPPRSVRVFQNTFTDLIEAFCPSVILPVRGSSELKTHDDVLGLSIPELSRGHPATLANLQSVNLRRSESELDQVKPEYLPTGPAIFKWHPQTAPDVLHQSVKDRFKYEPSIDCGVGEKSVKLHSKLVVENRRSQCAFGDELVKIKKEPGAGESLEDIDRENVSAFYTKGLAYFDHPELVEKASCMLGDVDGAILTGLDVHNQMGYYFRLGSASVEDGLFRQDFYKDEQGDAHFTISRQLELLDQSSLEPVGKLYYEADINLSDSTLDKEKGLLDVVIDCKSHVVLDD